MRAVLHAMKVAVEAHAGQTRRYLHEPYVTHPIAVAALAQQVGLGEDEIAAALLHDVVEDTLWTLVDLQDEGFSLRVVNLVERLTKWWGDDAPPEVKARQKVLYYTHLRSDPAATVLKILDRIDNLRTMVRCVSSDRPWVRRYVAKSEREIGPLVELQLQYPAPGTDPLQIQALWQDALSRTAAAVAEPAVGV